MSNVLDKTWNYYKNQVIPKIKRVYHYFDLDGKKQINSKEEELLLELKNTKQELEYAKNYFNNVTDPELVAHASYLLKASDQKYSYLLSKAKRNGIKGYTTVCNEWPS